MKPATFIALAAIFLSPLAGAEERANLLNMVTGAVVLSRSEYNDSSWSSFNLFDDDPKSIWCSPENRTANNEIVVELPQRHRLDAIVLDNTKVQEEKYPGVSARSIELWVSTTSAEAGFHKAAAFEAPKAGRKEFAIPKETSAEWLKIVIVDNWGHKQYTEMDDIAIYGAAEGPPAKRASTVSGVYLTNYGPLQLVQDGTRVTGCWAQGAGRVAGSTDGRVVQLQWWRDPKYQWPAILVLTTRGDMLNGLWYQGGSLQGTWSGKRAESLRDQCGKGDDATLQARLKNAGRAIAYGIHFRSDSDVLEADSEPVLQEISAALKSSPQLRLRVEGHTDSTNTDAYNLGLSKRRAASVVAWLTAHGIDAKRLASEGFGKAKPVADNATPQGRALNRRVELVAEKT